ncbi:hypothetical protein POX_a00890 [Penicillium oxalicum]|uniref:hypothetical protein n=1 Tax=Penicillium oxalicum TaxID=69781 RepID=UPI0020B6574F|nr:hypothetical protein POX_a00890 [Penicillium oxalicum]KAI2794295.1 hypothetical protein POX_a00890 [Penicillium oxalicum]
MFVPKTAAASRNPRRRQRSSDDSTKPPKPKRQRSVLRQSGDAQVASLNHELRELAETTISVGPPDLDTVTTPIGIEAQLPIRGAKPAEETPHENEGRIVLSSTDYYTVEQLPALPDQIRGSLSGEFKLQRAIFNLPLMPIAHLRPIEPLRCFFAPTHRYALALTPSHAIIWPYSVTNSTPSTSETFTVSIPESSRDVYGAVPLGALISATPGGHPGLLVVIPSTGRMIYWETVSSAASLGLSRQKQNGVQGQTPGLFSGEYATEIMSCEPSGIIIAFSSGRVAHVTLRDPQGKPSVLVHFLSTSVGGGAVGFFGGLKSVLSGGSWRKEVTAVRTGASRQRGQRDVLVATSTGQVEIWDTHWNHGNALKKRFDLKGPVAASIPQDYVTMPGDTDVKILDFALSEQQSVDEPDESWRLFVVISTPELLEAKRLLIAQVSLSGAHIRVTSTHAVDITSLPPVDGNLKPKLHIPRGESTAFVLFGQSLVILSLTSTEESPTSQLLLESHQIPLPFQDVIHFRSGKAYEILGHDVESSPDHEGAVACVMMVRNFGVVRINVVPRFPSALEADEGQVTAKHKLEQAIFFGTMAKNPLNLLDSSGLNFPASEIEQASLEICRELLQSETRFIPTSAISIDQNLRLRAKALGDLAALLLRKGNPLSRLARWELLWGAEKLAAQRAMWKLEESRRGKSDEAFLGNVIDSMKDKFKTLPSQSNEDVDALRLWFLKDTYRMEHVIPWIKNAIKPRRGTSSKQARKLSEQILEASELFLAIVETAYRYRDEHASLYGLGSDFVEDGVLADGYENLPNSGPLDLWVTPRPAICSIGNWTAAEHGFDRKPRRAHLRVLGQMHRERTRWLGAQDDAKAADECVAIEQSHVKERKWQLFKLAGIGHLQDALSLAERFRDMGALVELVIELQDQVKGQGSPINAQVSTFCHSFLRKSHAYSKLSWINDVTGEQNYETAAVCLEGLTLNGEEELWSHRVQLSIAKLSKLASTEQKESRASITSVEDDIKRLDDANEIDEIQDSLHTYVKSFCEDAIDRRAAADLALGYFGGHLEADRPALHKIMDDALLTLFDRRILGPDRLIDLLTLMGPLHHEEEMEVDLGGREFFLALQTLDHSRYAQKDPSYVSAVRKLIWRRCMIKDDWEARGRAAEQMSGPSDDFASDTALSQTIVRCLAATCEPSVQLWNVPLAPAEALMADSESDILVSRFRPEQQARIAADLRRENEICRRYIEHGKLDFWFQNLLDTVKTEIVSHGDKVDEGESAGLGEPLSTDAKA